MVGKNYADLAIKFNSFLSKLAKSPYTRTHVLNGRDLSVRGAAVASSTVHSEDLETEERLLS